MGASKNLEFAQTPHKGTPIRYGQKQPVRNRQQGAQRGKQASRVADARKKILVSANLKVTLH